MESAQHRARHDRATRRRVIGQPWLARDALADPLVWAARVEVWHPFGQDPPKVILAEDQDVVEAFATEAAEEAFADGIGVSCRLHHRRAVRHKPFELPIPSIRSVAGRFS